MHLRFIYRQISTSWKQTSVFVACVTLSLVTLVALGGFGDSVNNSLLRDARKLVAADIIVESGFPFEEALQAEFETLTAEDGIERALTAEFISIVRLPEREETLLSELKLVEPGYPFYGEVGLRSGRLFSDMLVAGNVIVGQDLLDRLDLAIGDPILVGEAELTIVDVVESEGDRPVDFFTIGPRIFVSSADREAINLIKPGSRVWYTMLLRVEDESRLDAIAEQLTAVADPAQVQIDTFRTNQSSVQSFFENFLTFLNLIGIFTLMLAGIGIQSALSSFLKEREATIAVIRTFGATSRFVQRQFFAVAALLGAVGTIFGILLGLALQYLFPIIFATFLPPQVEFTLSLRAIVEGVLLGIIVVGAFTYLPLYQIQEFKPSFIFRKESLPLRKGWAYYVAVIAILGFFTGLVFWYLRDIEQTGWFALGTVVLVTIAALLTHAILSALRRLQIRPLAARQALRGLFRPRNATAAIIITLTTSLAVLFTLYLIERNLDASFVEAFPEDAPNLFILDIQPDQREGVREELGIDTTFLPIVRARVASINGERIEPRADEGGPGDGADDEEGGPPLDIPFSLTYQRELGENERLQEGAQLFRDEEAGIAQVSVSAIMLGSYPFELGDRIVFDIQGVSIESEVVSIRADPGPNAGFTPAFNFVLREQDLRNAPQTIVTTAKLPEAEIPALQNRLINAFPNLTVINIAAVVDTAAELVGNITTIIRFFTLFGIIAGVLIIISSVLATRFARIQEAVYFKVLGAKRRFVLRIFALENVFMGLLSAALALGLSQLAGWLVVTQLFELRYIPYIGSSVLLLLFTVLLVTAVGLLASASILRQKPITFLREQTVE